MIPADLHSLFPRGFYLLLFLFPMIWIGWQLFVYRRKSLQKLGLNEALKSSLIPRSPLNYWAKLTALLLVWILATAALTQPVGQGRYSVEKEDGKAHDVILLVDASGSMDLKDTRTGVSRLDFAKEIGDEIISRLNGENVALYAFTSETTQLSPRTVDYLFSRIMLQQIRINEGDSFGTNFAKVLGEIQKLYFSKPSQTNRTLIIISDGENEAGKVNDPIAPLSENNRVFTIGVGSISGAQVPGTGHFSKLDEKWLQEVAQKGNGTYFNANRMTAEEIANRIAVMDFSQKVQKGDLVYDRYFQYPLALALLLTGFLLFFPDTTIKKGCFLFLLIPLQLYSGVGREAEGFYQAGIYDQAIVLYQELENQPLPDWQRNRVKFNLATAYMMKEEWEKGIRILESISNPSAWLEEKIKERLKLARQQPEKESSWREPSDQLSEKEKQMLNVLQELQQMEQQDRVIEKVDVKVEGRW